MRLRTRGLLLLSFAFSTLLVFSKATEIPIQSDNGKETLKSTIKSPPAQNDEGKTTNPKTSNHDVDKRSAEEFPREETKIQELYEPNNADKRARLGFTGMRGKKEYSSDDYCARNMRARLEGALNKRYFRSFNELFGGKRASLAFHGMRGKKSQDYENEILEPEDYDTAPRQEFLINSGLIDDPGEREFGNGKTAEEEVLDEEMNKRSPYAFQGMRGKKENFDFKRAMGFLGMRGKKATDVWDLNTSYKRVPQTSFFGMKGKKAQSGFFGMRGKKALPDAFFGIKGKREPLGDESLDFSLLNQLNDSGPSRNRFRRGISWLNNSKKAKNAFFGIRGKKSTQENSNFSSF